MKNKHYNIFFTSEKDGTGKSLRLSQASLILCILSCLCMIVFSYIGINRVIGSDSIAYELDLLRKHKYITSNLLIESGLRETVVSSEDLEQIIIEYIITHNIIHPSSPPIEGYVTKGVYKKDKDILHAGLNIASKNRDQVISPLDGIVVVASKNGESGYSVILHHQNNFFTIYKNLDTLFVEPRDLILKGQPFAKVGNVDGNGSHLHFEIWKDNQVVDPRNLIVDYKEKDVSIR